MTTIGSIVPSRPSSASAASDNLIGNYETFLKLLTTQLKNQDPTKPMDPSQFTEQLVQYSGIEQQIKTNTQLEDLGAMMTSNNALSALNFLYTTVTIDGSKGYLNQVGSVNYKFDAKEAGSATMVIRNENGQIVSSKSDIEIKAGSNEWKWDGLDDAGRRLPKGSYSIQIIAKNDNQQTIDINTDQKGEVTHVDVSGSEPMLTVGDQTIKMNQIKAVGVKSSAS